MKGFLDEDEVYPVYSVTLPPDRLWGEAEQLRDIPDELYHRWQLACTEFYAVQDLLQKIG